jgi:hypothetical protein
MIERCRESFPVAMMCQALKVSTSGYYQWRSGEPSARQQDNARLLRKIRRVHGESDGVFGSPRVWEELRYDGKPCGLNRVAKLMKANAIVGIPSRRQWRKRKPGIRPSTVINHLDRDFSSSLHISPRIRSLRCSWRNSLVNRSKSHSDSYGLRRICRNVKPDAVPNRIGQTVTLRNCSNAL